MSLCEFDEDNGEYTFRCAKQASHRVTVVSDCAGNPPYEVLYCPDHAAYYLAGGGVDPRSGEPAEAFSIVELPHLAYAVVDTSGDDDDG